MNPHCRDIYYKNFEELPDGDIQKIDVTRIPQHDILCAGFPCQFLSIAGKKKGIQRPTRYLILPNY